MIFSIMFQYLYRRIPIGVRYPPTNSEISKRILQLGTKVKVFPRRIVVSSVEPFISVSKGEFHDKVDLVSKSPSIHLEILIR